MNKKVLIILCTVLVLATFFAGCNGSEKKNGLQVYFLNLEGTALVPETYETDTTDQVELVNELLARLQKEPDQGDLHRTLSSNIAVNGCLFKGNTLVVDFSEDYYSMPMTEEVLTRAAIVKTVLQVEGITSVSFTVDSTPLVNADGVEVGIMNADSFVENPGAQINSTAQTTLTLFFASSDGTYLKKETRTVHYSSNISMDKLVMEQLMEGPKTSGLQATIPSGTRLVTISTVDGVCYVNLDEAFKNQNAEITEAVVLYSIVNSLSQLPDVEKVQISINGDTSGKCRYDMDLSTMYEANSDILKSSKDESNTEDGTEADLDKNDDSSNKNDTTINNSNGANSPDENLEENGDNTKTEVTPEAGVSSDLKVN